MPLFGTEAEPTRGAPGPGGGNPRGATESGTAAGATRKCPCSARRPNPPEGQRGPRGVEPPGVPSTPARRPELPGKCTGTEPQTSPSIARRSFPHPLRPDLEPNRHGAVLPGYSKDQLT